tara:strand:- start:683 stop:928 length:246 start_codon:yes stop_codon:yes gene_type:complete
MKTEYHFICEVKDSINNFDIIGSTYVNATTSKKAVDHFKKHPFIKKHLKNERYQIEIRQNTILLQDSFDFLKEWKKQKRRK